MWNTSNVRYMHYMFANASAFNQAAVLGNGHVGTGKTGAGMDGEAIRAKVGHQTP